MDTTRTEEAPTPAPPAPTEELTDIGVQYVIPGCERRKDDDGPTQGSLW
jgi:hypothetical protein